MITYNIVCVIVLELLDVGVNQRLGVAAFDTEFLLASESGSGKEDEFHQGNNTIVFNDFRGCFGLADLLSDDLGRIQEINLAIYSVLEGAPMRKLRDQLTFNTRAHLASTQACYHWCDEMSALEDCVRLEIFK